jgi:Ferritin-like
LKIEEPQRLVPRSGAMLVEEIDVPGSTIGEFYSNIIALLSDLERKGSGQLLVGDPKRQISQDYYWSGGGQIVAAHALASAKVALDLVISKREGAWPKLGNSASTRFGRPLKMGTSFSSTKLLASIDTRALTTRPARQAVTNTGRLLSRIFDQSKS